MKLIRLTKENDEWQEDTSTNIEIEKIKDVFFYTDVGMLFEFYNSTDNPDFQGINVLKPFVKDPNGALNIGKLAEAIEGNRNNLDQYLEN